MSLQHMRIDISIIQHKRITASHKKTCAAHQAADHYRHFERSPSRVYVYWYRAVYVFGIVACNIAFDAARLGARTVTATATATHLFRMNAGDLLERYH
jgi:hypothetical protein